MSKFATDNLGVGHQRTTSSLSSAHRSRLFAFAPAPRHDNGKPLLVRLVIKCEPLLLDHAVRLPHFIQKNTHRGLNIFTRLLSAPGSIRDRIIYNLVHGKMVSCGNTRAIVIRSRFFRQNFELCGYRLCDDNQSLHHKLKVAAYSRSR